MIISKLIENYTASISNFETKRNYISLSHCSLPVDQILNTWFNGFEDSHEIRLRCYKGYQMERDFKQRLIAMTNLCFTEHEEIEAYGGLVKGHPDLQFYPESTSNGIPSDCKSVPLDIHLPEKLLPKKVYWQMQGYMLYGKRDRALVLYESRETGIIRDYLIRENASIQREIDLKMQTIVQQIKKAA